MSREIKYRAWHKTKEKYYLIVSLNFYTQEVCIGKPSNYVWVPFDYVVLEQYTGLNDNSGVDIYEGDIVKINWSDKLGECITSIVEIKNPFDYDLEEVQWLNYSNELTLIGNIHEDKGMLK